MNNNYRENERKESEQDSKIDLGKKYPEAKDVKPQKEKCPNYGKHGPE